MDFESCVLEKNSECNYLEGEKSNRDHRLQSLFFCGHDEECRHVNLLMKFRIFNIFVFLNLKSFQLEDSI